MPNCLLCGTPNRFLFSARDYATDDQTHRALNWCDRCSFGRLDGDFTPEQIGSFYPPGYYTHVAGHEPGGSSSFLNRLLVHLAWRMDAGKSFHPSELPPGKTVCDIGCGNGGELRRFKLAGYRATGVDPDPKARTAAADAGDILIGTAEDLPDLTTFDVVLMSHVLEHCIDPNLAIANAGRLLARGGTLVVEVPNSSSMGFRKFGPAWPWTDIPRHLNFFTYPSLEAILSRNGLVVTKVFYTGFTRQFSSWWREEQRKIWRKIRPGSVVPGFTLAAWMLLAKSLFADDFRKYDSIRIHARSA